MLKTTVQLEKRKRNKYGLFGSVTRTTSLLSIKNIAGHLRFAKLNLSNLQDFWNNILWIDETKVEMLGYKG